MRYALVLFVLFPSYSFASDFNDVLQAIRQVETGGCKNQGKGAKGDNGLARGPYQIHREYWKDAVTFNKTIGGTYADCDNLAYSQKVVTAYLRHYAASAIVRGNWSTVARIHNGGPQGYRVPATQTYWQKVERKLTAIESRKK